ncbi:zeta toxin family protein [Sphingobacterium paludis]|uniref:Putative ABC-type ATPase n=1 Tax=Sphingobacterium paludis TaxID=1476465 RepID=A0A4R7D4R2_9SPHI|nr:zeta toxin family protein [Sphingobacterium paludis]TDS13856.1 putative ABC-type ATPase [Sphingobacterium paludis]
MPELFVITGSNGAGKSTVGPAYFPEHLQEVFDGDKLYLSRKSDLWRSGIRVQKELNRQASEFVEVTFINLVNSAISSRRDFAYEGHFSQDESLSILHQFKDNQYTLHLIFFGLENVDTSMDRVLIRAREGGHNVDLLTIRDNYFGNLRQLNDRRSLFNTIKVIDTSELEHKDLVFISEGTMLEALDIEQQPRWF